MHTFHGLFTWCRYDAIDTVGTIFYDVELLIDVGEHKAGTQLVNVYWDVQNFRLYIGDDTEGISFKLVPIF